MNDNPTQKRYFIKGTDFEFGDCDLAIKKGSQLAVRSDSLIEAPEIHERHKGVIYEFYYTDKGRLTGRWAKNCRSTDGSPIAVPVRKMPPA